MLHISHFHPLFVVFALLSVKLFLIFTCLKDSFFPIRQHSSVHSVYLAIIQRSTPFATPTNPREDATATLREIDRVARTQFVRRLHSCVYRNVSHHNDSATSSSQETFNWLLLLLLLLQMLWSCCCCCCCSCYLLVLSPNENAPLAPIRHCDTDGLFFSES